MKKLYILSVIAVTCFLVAGAAAYAQYLTESIPDEDRVASIEVVELTRKVNSAKKMIEEKGEIVITEFYEDDSKWIGPEEALFIIEATKDHENEGLFMVYPDPKNVGKGALEMSRVNGKHFARKAHKDKKKKEKEFWLGFIAGQPGKLQHATTIALLPGGRTLAITAANQNLKMEEHFLVSLVNAACEVIRNNGEKGFPILGDEDSDFRFKDTYVYVLDTDGKILFDPGHENFEDKNVRDFPVMYHGFKFPAFADNPKDVLALAIASEFPKTPEDFMKMAQDVLLKNGYAWVAYSVGKPGMTKLSHKICYEKVVPGPDGKEYVVGSGVYVAGDKDKK